MLKLQLLYALLGTGGMFLATCAGAAMVFLFWRSFSCQSGQVFMGFSAGVMLAAGVWSLLLPAMERLNGDKMAMFWLVGGGFLLGGSFLWLMDRLSARLLPQSLQPGQNTALLVLAITLHNLPEGMAVGLSFAVAAAQNEPADLAAAFVLALGMSLQNFPEGAAVSLPLRSQGMGAGKAFGLGVLSGAVEPLFGLVAVLAAGSIAGAMPLVLSFAAGAMVYVVAQEMIPQATSAPHAQAGVASILVGFWLMMLLDALLG
ncbi:MAG: ZIP family metal transporter [Pygmaiobacter massiliensis]|jgi:ZIP family zinc transporter|nr:ZIP family metal transporter [Pygmaiobacter massiliensis]